MKTVRVIQVIFLIFSGIFVFGFNPKTDSLLLSLDMAKDEKLMQNYSQNTSNSLNITRECSERKYDYTVYYRMVYFRVCESILEFDFSFEQVCNYLQSPQAEKGKNLTEDFLTSFLGSGEKTKQLWLANESCRYINEYYKAKVTLKPGTYPNYTEWFIYSTPFSRSVGCGFTARAYYGKTTRPSSSDCLPNATKWGLYSTFIIDGLLVIIIFFANAVVIMVSIKSKVYTSTHGQLRISLAVADLLTALVVCGSIYTTYKTYFGPHQFYNPGEPVRFTDYHPQSYIDGFGVLTIIVLAASVFNLVAITIDRFIALFRPLIYKLHRRLIKSCNYIAIAFIWLLSLVIALIPIFLPDSIDYGLTALGVIIAPEIYLVYVVCLGGSLLCVWIVNLWMLLSLKGTNFFSLKVHDTQYSKNSKSSNISTLDKKLNPCGSSNGNTTKGYIVISTEARSMDLQLASTVRLIVVAFSIPVVSVIVVMVTGLSNTLEPSSSEFQPTAKAIWNSFAYLSSRLLFANSFANCFIYSYKISSFRNVAKSLFTFNKNGSGRTIFTDTKQKTKKEVRRTSSEGSLEETI